MRRAVSIGAGHPEADRVAQQATPHVRVAAQRAAYDAYNARASRLNSQMAAARKNYNACKAAVRELFELDIKQDPPSPDPTAVAKIRTPQPRSPPDTRLPPCPSQPALRPGGRRRRVATLYDALDDVSLTDSDTVKLQNVSKPDEGDQDPPTPPRAAARSSRVPTARPR